MNTQPSKQNGELKKEVTEIPLDTQSSNGAAKENTSVMLDTTPQTSHNSQPIRNLQDAQTHTGLIMALALKLKTLVEWRKLTLQDGRVCIALCFDLSVWEVSDDLKLVLRELKERMVQDEQS